MRDLSEIKNLIEINYTDYLKSNELIWLVEQAEALQEIKKLTRIENLYDFAKEVLRIIEKLKIPTRKPRV